MNNFLLLFFYRKINLFYCIINIAQNKSKLNQSNIPDRKKKRVNQKSQQSTSSYLRWVSFMNEHQYAYAHILLGILDLRYLELSVRLVNQMHYKEDV